MIGQTAEEVTMSELNGGLVAHKWGAASVLIGGIALIVSSLVIFAGPFAPQQSVGTSIGQIIGEISLSAMNTVRGAAAPDPVATAWDIDRILMITGPVLAVLGFFTAVIAYFRDPKSRLPTYGTALGAAAITLQFFWMLALIIIGGMILIAIITEGPGFLEL